MLARAALMVVAGLAMTRPALAGPDCAGDDLDTCIRRTLEVRGYTLQTLEFTAGTATSVSIALRLGDRDYIADVTLAPVDAPGCTMVLDDGSGELVELPPPAPVTYRGAVRGVEGSMVTGSLIAGQFTGIVYLSEALSAWNVLPLDQVVKGMPRGLHVVTRFEDMEDGPWTCGGAVPVGVPGAVRAPVAGPDASYYCDLAIDADYPYFQAVGGTASTVAQDISTVVANVTSYSMISGCNLRFQIVRYLIRTTSAGNPPQYNVTDPNTLLTNFRTVWNNLAGAIGRDTAHLFTGQDLTGTTIGIAYLGVVCNSTFGYGLSESRFSLQPGRRAALTAHELGHNFSANPCDVSPNICTPCWLMLTSQGSTTNQLTRYGCSTSIIGNYAAARPCLDFHLTGSACTPDFNHDGVLTAADLAAYYAAFRDGDLRADMDGDGRLTISDTTAFLNAYAAGCQ
jgi:hypothetical protein